MKTAVYCNFIILYNFCKFLAVIENLRKTFPNCILGSKGKLQIADKTYTFFIEYIYGIRAGINLLNKVSKHSFMIKAVFKNVRSFYTNEKGNHQAFEVKFWTFLTHLTLLYGRVSQYSPSLPLQMPVLRKHVIIRSLSGGGEHLYHVTCGGEVLCSHQDPA